MLWGPVPIRDEGATREAFLTLAGALLERLGVVAALPEAERFHAPSRAEFKVAEGARVVLESRAMEPDPYAGGPVHSMSLTLYGVGNERLEVTIDEVAWVGSELTATVEGPEAWRAPLAAIVEAHVATFAK